MPHTLTQYKNLPIFILTNVGRPSEETTLQQYQELDQMLSQQTERVYMIIDNRQLDFGFADTMMLFKLSMKGGKGTPSDERIKQAVFISENKMMSTVRDIIYKISGRNFPVFPSPEEALEYILKRSELDVTQGENAS